MIRPPRVLAAGMLQSILGLLSIPFVIGLAVSLSRAEALGEADAIVLLLLSAAQGALDLAAGILILRLRPAGWTLGILMASFGLVFVVLSLGRAVGASITALIGIGLRLAVIVLLALERDRFRPPRRRESPRA